VAIIIDDSATAVAFINLINLLVTLHPLYASIHFIEFNALYLFISIFIHQHNLVIILKVIDMTSIPL
jgi:hypothetical protein